jgi:hypothetical protein
MFKTLATVVLCGAVGFGIGAGLTDQATEVQVPLCWEDEVTTRDGECVPLDDATYIGGVGWVREFGTESHWVRD